MENSQIATWTIRRTAGEIVASIDKQLARLEEVKAHCQKIIENMQRNNASRHEIIAMMEQADAVVDEATVQRLHVYQAFFSVAEPTEQYPLGIEDARIMGFTAGLDESVEGLRNLAENNLDPSDGTPYAL